tara:strand:- start:780 stop:962 length:183 start_codon:yes stop_codon:yes gene_type:complete
MTRKDYIKIADVFKYAYDEAEDIRERSILDIMLYEMMHTLKADNSRFDKTRFVDYINFNK